MYEDEHLLALDKPALLLTSPDRADAERLSLIRLLHEHIQRAVPWATKRGLTYLMNAHRLDYETSGVLLLTKGKPVLIALANLFSSDKPILTCAALVQGVPQQETMVTEAKLAPVERHPQESGDQTNRLTPHPSPLPVEGRGRTFAASDCQMRVDERRGKRSKTEFRIRERFAGYALLECRPFTHRPHQIRAHLRQLRFPIAGDTDYGGSPLLLSQLKSEYRLKPRKTERPLISHPAIYVEELSMAHPVTGTQITIKASCPKDFAVALKYLRRYAAP